MKTIAVIDLDGTLLTTDSFRLYLLRHMTPGLAFWSAVRTVGVISGNTFCEMAHRRLSGCLEDEKTLARDLDFLERQVNVGLLAFIKKRLSRTEVLIVSASPHEYVSALAGRLGFTGYGSRWVDGVYFHCRGMNKLALIEKEYPSASHEYFLSLNDSREEHRLFERFTHNFLWNGDLDVLTDAFGLLT